jgi:preprotein translocase subunit SecF
MRIKLIPDVTNIDFIGKRYIAFVVSIVLLIASIALIATRGLNFGIDFTGGTLIEFRVEKAPELDVVRKQLTGIGVGDVAVQTFGAPDTLLLRLPEQPGGPEAQQAGIEKVRSALNSHFGKDSLTYRRTEFVGPQVGEELKQAGALAVLFAIAGILAYIWARFEWQFSIAAIAALLHDTLATLGLFALTQMQFNLATVAALLMIAGYSINDTVVVFDRIRENLRKYKKMRLVDLFNMSVNQMLARTVMTSVTTLIALLALWLFGGEVIRDFVNALLFGVVIGTYSSVFVASSVLLYLNIRREPKAETEAESV